MNFRIAGNRRSITWRQAKRVLIVSLAVGLLIFGFEARFLYQSTLEETHSAQQDIIELALTPSTAAAWDLNEQLANETLEGLLKIELVAGGRIILTDEGSFSEKSKQSIPLNHPYFSNLLHPFFQSLSLKEITLLAPEVARDRISNQVIGKLLIEFDTLRVTDKFVEQIEVVLWGSLMRVFLLALVLGIVFHRFLTQPIMEIGNTLKSVNPDEPGLINLEFPQEHKKGEISFLVQRFNELLSRLSSSQKNLRYMATRDPLTGLPNRALIYEELSANIRRAKSNQSKFAVFFLDLDKFKRINDSMGHAAGDQFLCLIAQALTRAMPDRARIGRLGGDEFVIHFEHFGEISEVESLANLVLKTINQPLEVNHVTIETSCSVGIATFPEHGEDLDSLVRHADLAMYQAKTQGANLIRFFEPQMTQYIEARFNIETDLRQALSNQEFELFYQPKIDAKSKNLVGCEGLLRWNKNDELIPPYKFIPILEENQMIVPVGYWVIETACQAISKWLSSGFKINCSVNVSPIQLKDLNFFNKVSEIIQRYPSCSGYLELEITESNLMKNLESTQQLLSKLRTLGIKISIDDFGTGYSSLSYLRNLAIDKLKIDRSFITNIPDDVAISATIIALAKQLKLETVAEGVESLEQLEWLSQNDCDVIQGFYFSQPLRQSKFELKYKLNKKAEK